jgi:hypothetical protein
LDWAGTIPVATIEDNEFTDHTIPSLFLFFSNVLLE